MKGKSLLRRAIIKIQGRQRMKRRWGDRIIRKEEEEGGQGRGAREVEEEEERGK